jgi:hypothetical protein
VHNFRSKKEIVYLNYPFLIMFAVSSFFSSDALTKSLSSDIAMTMWNVDQGTIGIGKPRLVYWNKGVAIVQAYCAPDQGQFDVYLQGPGEIAIVEERPRRRDELIEIDIVGPSGTDKRAARALLSPHGGESLIVFAIGAKSPLLAKSRRIGTVEFRHSNSTLSVVPKPDRRSVTEFLRACRAQSF